MCLRLRQIALSAFGGEDLHWRGGYDKLFARLTGGNKELVIIPGAVHTDLYDRKDIIPFDKIEGFLRKYLG